VIASDAFVHVYVQCLYKCRRQVYGILGVSAGILGVSVFGEAFVCDCECVADHVYMYVYICV